MSFTGAHAGGATVSKPPITYTFTHSAVEGGSSTNYNFTSVAIGSDTADRMVVCCIPLNHIGSLISSVTILGTSATEVFEYDGINSGGGIWAATGVTGTNGTVNIALSSGLAKGIGVYDVKGASGTTASDTLGSNADPMTGTIDCPAGGVIIGGAAAYAPSSTAWTGIDADAFLGALDGGGEDSGMLASKTFAEEQTGLTITCDPNTSVSERGMFIASFGP